MALVVAAVLGVAACGGSSSSNTAGPHPTVSNPGPNSSAPSNPGPNPTAGAPQTVNGTLALVGGCPRLEGPSVSRSYELALPAGWAMTARGLLIDDVVEAQLGDEVFVSGHPSSRPASCAPSSFAVATLVSVIPHR